MKPIFAATASDGTKVYGKLVGTFELVIDNCSSWYPGWVPDCEFYYYDALQLIDGTIMALEPDLLSGGYTAFIPDDDYTFCEYAGMIACHEYGHKKNKRGKHSNSSNRRANRERILNSEPLPF